MTTSSRRMGLKISVFGGNRSESSTPNFAGRQVGEAKPHAVALRELHKDDDNNYIDAFAGLCSPSIFLSSSLGPIGYWCPYVGCKRKCKHQKFHPLETMLCVKNLYRWSHCPKLLTCMKCEVKKFRVVAPNVSRARARQVGVLLQNHLHVRSIESQRESAKSQWKVNKGWRERVTI